MSEREKHDHDLTALARNDESATRRVSLRSGYAIETAPSGGGEVLTIYATDGQACLEIVLTPAGPIVQVRAAALRVAAEGALSLECEQFVVRAERDIRMQAGSSIVQSAGDNVETSAGGLISSEGHAQHLRARLGDVRLQANDDVELDGERILLNSPKDPRHVALDAGSSRPVEPK